MNGRRLCRNSYLCPASVKSRCVSTAMEATAPLGARPLHVLNDSLPPGPRAHAVACHAARHSGAALRRRRFPPGSGAGCSVRAGSSDVAARSGCKRCSVRDRRRGPQGAMHLGISNFVPRATVLLRDILMWPVLGRLLIHPDCSM